MLWSRDELIAALGAGGTCRDAAGLSIDTRTLRPGDLFFALAAARDGHDFVADALAKGAAGAVVTHSVTGADELVVGNVLDALVRLARAGRARSAARVVGVTGSVGKTTTKEMLRAVLGAFGATYAATASFNNHIGVPLTLASLAPDQQFAAIEIGMNHPGEVEPLARLASPHVAVITSIGAAHIGQMGSLAGIAREKAAIFRGLVPGGAAVWPVDAPHADILAEAVPAGVRSIGFGSDAAATIRLLAAASDAGNCAVRALVAGREVAFRLAAPGTHMAMDALAALGAAHALGLDPQRAARALDGFAPVAGRGARREFVLPGGGTALLIDESYNASGPSMRAALEVLRLQSGRRIAALGDMLELGEAAQAEHRALAAAAAEAADVVFACGENMRALVDALPDSKLGAYAPTAAALAPLLRAALRPGDKVLVKGSNGSRMRDVVAILEGSA